MRMRAASTSFALCLLMAHLPSPAQLMPRPYASGETRGQVVDGASGQPVEGAVVVGRWEWLKYHSTLESHGYYPSGEVVHLGEATTGRDGRFALAGWGPTLRSGGKLDDKAPNLIVFKPGYEPLVKNSGGTPGEGAIRLRKSTASPKDYAASIARVQQGDGPGLAWQHASDDWKAMPRMILALHREKARLGPDGAAIRGGNLLFGRAGRGELVDAQSGREVYPAVISITWTLRREDGAPGTRRLVEQKRSGVEGSNAGFYVSPWRLPQPKVPGWEIATDLAPLVRAYAPGYRKHPDVAWEERGGTLRLQKLPETRDAVLEELRTWRRDIDAELASGAPREEALAGQRRLILSLEYECGKLTADVRAGLCFEPASDVGRFIADARIVRTDTMETAEGPREIRIVAAGSAPQAQAVAAPPGTRATGPGERVPVSGFSIEPAR
jgi:hypothetical protein